MDKEGESDDDYGIDEVAQPRNEAEDFPSIVETNDEAKYYDVKNQQPRLIIAEREMPSYLLRKICPTLHFSLRQTSQTDFKYLCVSKKKNTILR